VDFGVGCQILYNFGVSWIDRPALLAMTGMLVFQSSVY